MSGEIDSTVPVGTAHLIERSSSLIHQHGGVATEFTFDSVEEMSLDTFIEQVVPTLRQRKDFLGIIKDMNKEQMVRILADNVALYHVTGMQDVFYDAMIEKLMSDQQITLTPNMQFPLIQWRVEQSGMKVITVEIPPAEFAMHHDAFKKAHVIWHPRLWLKMRLTVQNVPEAWRLRAVEQHPQDLEHDHVCFAPFPNVYDSGDICWGSTMYNRPGNGALTENAAVLLTLDRFFGSNFNYDLIDSHDMMNMTALYDQLPKLKEFDTPINECSGGSKKAHLLRMFRCFREVENMQRFKLRQAETAAEFLERSL